MNDNLEREEMTVTAEPQWYTAVLGVIVLAFVCIACGGHFYCAYRQTESESYPSVNGIINECYRDYFGTDGESELVVAYSYEVDGETYFGSKIRYVYRMFSSDSALVRQRCGKWEEGQPVEVFYNPDNPADAILDKGFCPGDVRTLGACVAVFCAFAIPISLWLVTLMLKQLPLTRRWLARDLEIAFERQSARVQLPKITPCAITCFCFAAFAVAATVLSRAADFFLLAPAWNPQALLVLYVTAPALVISGLISWHLEGKRYGLEDPELVVDTSNKTITFPDPAERGKRAQIALADVEQISVTSTGKEPHFELDRVTHAVTLTVMGVARNIPVARYYDLRRATQLADWLQTLVRDQQMPLAV
jgi:hypothetical protein